MFSRLHPLIEMIDHHGGPIDGEVELDKTYIGGKAKNMHANYRWPGAGELVGIQPVAGFRSPSRLVKAKAIKIDYRHEPHTFIYANVTFGSQIYWIHLYRYSRELNVRWNWNMMHVASGKRIDGILGLVSVVHLTYWELFT